MAGHKSRDRLTDRSGAAPLAVNEQLLLVFVTGKLFWDSVPSANGASTRWFAKGNIECLCGHVRVSNRSPEVRPRSSCGIY